MNPWSRAETGAGEETQRELFARRARALPPASLPALEDVLRAADESRERKGARGRALMGALLAAACFAAAVTAMPTLGPLGPASRAAIVADDAGIAVAVALAGGVESDDRGVCEEAHSGCTDHGAVASSDEPPACFTPRSPSVLPVSVAPYPACEGEMSCASATP